MENLVAVVTYTQHAHKKPRNRKWQDGKLTVNAVSWDAVLTSEDGKVIVEGKLPKDAQLEAGGEEVQLSASVLVLIDDYVVGSAAAAMPAGLEARPEGGGGGENVLAQAAPPPSKLFAGPRLASPPQQLQLPCKQVCSRFAAPLQAKSRQPPLSRAADNSGQRSTEEILQLLSGATHPPGINNGGKSTAAGVEPPAKRLKQPGTAALPPRWGEFSGHPQKGVVSNAVGPLESRLYQPLRPAAPQQKWARPTVDPFALPPPGSASLQRQGKQPPPQPDRATGSGSGQSSRANGISSAVESHSNGAVQLRFPSADECSRLRRVVAVPDRFPSAAAYQQGWENALLEEVNLRLAESAQGFRAACARANPPPAAGPQADDAALAAALQKARVPYHGQCELFIWRNYPDRRQQRGGWRQGGGRRRKARRGRGGGSDGDVSDPDEGPAKPDTCYLILKSFRLKGSEYKKGDMWVLSSHPLLQAGAAPGQVVDSTKTPWAAVARSFWHGPNQDGKFEIEFLGPRPPNLGKSQAVYALKGPDASTELALLDLFRSPALRTLPILPHLLGSPAAAASSLTMQADTFPAPLSSARADQVGEGMEQSPAAAAEAVAVRFGLNEEQAAVLQHVAAWGMPGTSQSPAAPPVCLIHGPFGTGKSSLLVAILHFVLSQRGKAGSPLAVARVLVSAHTNVAVDRVLLGLLKSGRSDFLRVGPLRRVDRGLLHYSLHASESRAHATAAAELKDMLREAEAAGNPAEQVVLKAELALAEQGAERQRRRLLKTVPIVGVTCCSALLSALDDHTFDIVLLDESSQMIEPLSLVPALRARCRYLVAAGDPLQLPPVIASPPHPTADTAAQAAAVEGGGQLHGLLRPLFVRLAALGATLHLLRRQYRCHADISAVPNRMFYGGRLLDGCTPAQRPSLLPGLPALVFVDVRGQEQYSGRSTCNPQEAAAAVRAVERVLGSGVAPARCGVICFYRAQVALVRSLLDKRLQQMAEEQEHRLLLQGGKERCPAGQVVECMEGEEQPAEAAAGGAPPGEDGGSVQVATVDAFQGAEKDVIILTTAVTRPGAFASDACRLNVALTRARHNLVLVGCAPALHQAAPAFAAVLAKARAMPGGYSPSGNLPHAQLKPQPAASAMQGVANSALTEDVP